MDLEVFPKTELEDIYSDWTNLLSMKAVYTMTRSTVTFVDMPVIACDIDRETGIPSVSVSGAGLSEDFYKGVQNASARLLISDGLTFINCANLMNFTLPKNLEQIGDRPFHFVKSWSILFCLRNLRVWEIMLSHLARH